MNENTGSSWSHPYEPDPQYSKRVVYLSMEFAIDQSLKIYSGGLGYLAGSHMRAAFQLRQNMIGIGMLWKFGYYDQVRDEQSNMKVLYREKFYSFLIDTGIKVPVYIKGHKVMVKAYYLPPDIFQTAPMYFLTTDIDDNDTLARTITSNLYTNNGATRVAQSIVLGIGGGRVAEVLGGADLFHMNEAHSLPVAFYLLDKYKDLNETRKRLVFTTHTPVRAGNPVRSTNLLREMGFFNGLPFEKVIQLTGMYGQDFEYTPAAMRLSKVANGVSQMHGSVAFDMWKSYSGICAIRAITNSQDEKYWTDRRLKDAFEKNDDAALIDRKKQLKRLLFKIVADQEGDLFDENILTIVWARRFAEYKRAELIMRDIQRFEKLINNPNRPVQIIWAGKPHPEDSHGISVFNFVKSKTYLHKNIAILTGYELELSSALKKGADIWLNTPRRPKEASGTSGMTAAMNGAINLSIQDGWIPEFAHHGHNAFVLPIADENSDRYQQDNFDHENLMRILENEVVPMYYDRPGRWMEIVKNSMREVVPMFDSKRMAHEYYEKIYLHQFEQ